MALLGRRRPTARLAHELDDSAFDKVRKRLVESRTAAGHSPVVAMIEQLLRDSGRDWDRSAHPMSVLAESTSPEFQRSWTEERDQDPDARLLHAWGVPRRSRYAEQPDLNETYAALDACARSAVLRPENPSPWAVRLGLLRL